MIINPYRFAGAGGNVASYLAEQDVDSPLSRWLTPASGTAWDDDIVATGNDATSVNTPTLGAADPWAGTDGAFFERDNLEHVEAPHSASLDITGALSLECWVRVSSLSSSFSGVIAKYSSTGGSYRCYGLSISAAGNAYFTLSETGSFESANSLTGTSTMGSDWHHIVATYSPSSNQSLYVDGVLEAEKTSSVISSIFSSANAPLWVASWFNVSTAIYNFDGEIFAPTIYNTALSSTRVLAHYDAAGI
jgi:hypothetical protein